MFKTEFYNFIDAYSASLSINKLDWLELEVYLNDIVKYLEHRIRPIITDENMDSIRDFCENWYTCMRYKWLSIIPVNKKELHLAIFAPELYISKKRNEKKEAIQDTTSQGEELTKTNDCTWEEKVCLPEGHSQEAVQQVQQG